MKEWKCCKCGGINEWKMNENVLILVDINRTMHFYVRGFIMHNVDSSQFWLSHFGPKLVVGKRRILLIGD